MGSLTIDSAETTFDDEMPTPPASVLEPTEDEIEMAFEFASYNYEYRDDLDDEEEQEKYIDEEVARHAAEEIRGIQQGVLPSMSDLLQQTSGLPVPTELDWIRRPRNSENKEFDFILPGLCRGEVGILAGAGGGGKSYLALELAYSVACSVCFFKHDGAQYYWSTKDKPRKKVKVLNLEDSREVLWNRIGAIQDFSENEYSITDWNGVYVAACAEFAMYLKIINTRGDVNHNVVEWFKRQCSGVDLLILDPLSQIHSGDENNNGHMSTLMSVFKNIAISENVAMLIIHHASKGAVLNGQAGVQQAVRGASALVDSSRLTMTLLRDTETKEIKLSYPKVNGHEPLDTIILVRETGGILIDEDFKYADSPKTEAKSECVVPF